MLVPAREFKPTIFREWEEKVEKKRGIKQQGRNRLGRTRQQTTDLPREIPICDIVAVCPLATATTPAPII